MPKSVWNESKKPCLAGTIASFPGKHCDLNQSPPPPPSPPPPLSPPPLSLLQESLDELELSDAQLSDEEFELLLLNRLEIFQPQPLLPLEL